jgi:hypothetical protein
MPLPKIDVPVFNIELPFTKTKLKFRPFTVKEEKVLLFAQQSKDLKDIADAIKQVVQNCLIDDIDVATLPTFEVEFLFLRIRAQSVDNVIKLKIRESEDSNEWFDADLDLLEVDLKIPEEYKDKIALNDDYSMKLKFPVYGDVEKMQDLDLADEPNDIAFELIGESIESVYSNDGDEVHIMSEYDRAERKEFMESLSSKNFADIQAFLSSVPSLEKEITYVNADGKELKRVLRGLSDFFTFA